MKTNRRNNSCSVTHAATRPAAAEKTRAMKTVGVHEGGGNGRDIYMKTNGQHQSLDTR